MKTLIVLLSGVICGLVAERYVYVNEKSTPIFRTVVVTKNVTAEDDRPIESPSTDRNNSSNTDYRRAYIDVQIVDKPHNLFIGRCTPDLEELHKENIILNNDGKSHVAAEIRINVDPTIVIKCVKMFDQSPGSGAYPSYIGGGVSHNYVKIGVGTKYGKGFNFFIQIFGYVNKDDKSQEKPKLSEQTNDSV